MSQMLKAKMRILQNHKSAGSVEEDRSDRIHAMVDARNDWGKSRIGDEVWHDRPQCTCGCSTTREEGRSDRIHVDG